MTKPLKLRAVDEEDLAIISACLQDAVLPIGEMCFLPDEHRFVMVVNRFRWEAGPDIPDPSAASAQPSAGTDPEEGEVMEEPVYERIHCGLRFDGIVRVRSRGIDLHDRSQVLELLAIERVDEGLALHFAGGSCIKLESESWNLFVEDLGEPWPTHCCPCHTIDDATAETLNAALKDQGSPPPP